MVVVKCWVLHRIVLSKDVLCFPNDHMLLPWTQSYRELWNEQSWGLSQRTGTHWVCVCVCQSGKEKWRGVHKQCVCVCAERTHTVRASLPVPVCSARCNSPTLGARPWKPVGLGWVPEGEIILGRVCQWQGGGTAWGPSLPCLGLPYWRPGPLFRSAQQGPRSEP